jgi:16S rRNA (cytosine967-C5)-methyltransferase
LSLLTQVPPHAALNETVELAALFGRPRAKGFLNGVLRSCASLVTADRTDRPGPDALPLEGGTYRRLSRPILPRPDVKPIEYLAAAFGLPRWLTHRWVDRHGIDEVRRLGFWFAGPAPLTLRVNALRTTRDEMLQALQEAGHAAEPAEHPLSVRVREAANVRDLPGYAQGWFAVQDQSATRVAEAVAPRPGDLVLDLCAAPGGKTTHLAELMQDRGRVVACDIDEGRLATLRELAGRLGLSCIETRLMNAMRPDDAPAGPFDAVLVDVPCSNTGVLGRRPEVRWRLKPAELLHLVRLQTQLLMQAAERVRPGGTIVYSTCSIEPEENGSVVRAALRAMPDLELEAEEVATPGRPADGGYWARLRRCNV